MKRCSLLLLALVMLAVPVQPAAAETIRPGDILRLTFTLPTNLSCIGPCDVLLFSLALANNPSGPTSASLFDGSTLLGTFTTDADCQFHGTCVAGVPSFVAAGSVYGLNSPIIDFGSIRDGTINGRLDYRLTTSTEFQFNGQDTFVFVGHAAQTRTTNPGARGTITSETLIAAQPTPEPGSLLLVCSGLSAIALRFRRTRARLRA